MTMKTFLIANGQVEVCLATKTFQVLNKVKRKFVYRVDHSSSTKLLRTTIPHEGGISWCHHVYQRLEVVFILCEASNGYHIQYTRPMAQKYESYYNGPPQVRYIGKWLIAEQMFDLTSHYFELDIHHERLTLIWW